MPQRFSLIAEIEDGLQRVSEAVQRGELRLGGAKVKVRRLAAQRTPPESKDIRRGLYKAYPRVQFPDLIMAVYAETHFSAEILGRPADNDIDLLESAAHASPCRRVTDGNRGTACGHGGILPSC
jgi:hypothetical protein